MTEKFVSRKIVLQTLDISPMTLFKMAENKEIEYFKTNGGHHKYNLEKYITEHKHTTKEDNIKPQLRKQDICYVRVSTLSQKDDLERQKQFMKNLYPTYEIIEDIGSGINFNRKGFRKIITLAIGNRINKLVIAYKDRLTRFGYDLIEDLIKEYSGGEIIIVADNDTKKEPKEELVDDVMQILNVYTAKMNGLRKYGKVDQKKE